MSRYVALRQLQAVVQALDVPFAGTSVADYNGLPGQQGAETA